MHITEQDITHAQVIWDFMLMHMSLEKADVILVGGSHCVRTAEHVARLYREGWAPKIIFTGNRGRYTEHLQETEARLFADRAIACGVPSEDIFLEEQSTNTGENVRFAYALLHSAGVRADTVLLVHKPYMERRFWATFKKQWPDPQTKVLVSSEPLSLVAFLEKSENPAIDISVMVGDVLRFSTYAECSFQIPVDVPQEVQDACMGLVARGYGK